MICLRSAEVRITDHNLIIDGTLSDSLHKFIKKGDLLPVFDKTEVKIFKVCSIEKNLSGTSQKNILLKFSDYNKIPISPGIYESLFFYKKYLVAGENTVSGWISICSLLTKPKPILNIRIKQNSYIRFIYHQPLHQIFIEKYLQWDEWSLIQEELHNLRIEIDSEIKIAGAKRINEIVNIMRGLIENLFIKLGIPLFEKSFKGIDYITLDIYTEGKGIYLPIEIMENVLVRYLLPSPAARSRNISKNLTIIFSDKIDNYNREIQSLKDFLKDSFNTETFSDESYQEYKYNIRDSNYLHFTGHGKIIDGKGMIELDNTFTDRLQYSENLHTAFLNCCFAGLEADGIVLNLLQNGTEFVIASPYEITGSFSGGFSGIVDFYSFFCGTDTTLPFFLNSVKNRDFSLFYRLYGRYNGKI